MFLPKTYCVFAETIVRIASAKKFFEMLTETLINYHFLHDKKIINEYTVRHDEQ